MAYSGGQLPLVLLFDTIVLLARGKSQFAEKDKFEVSPDCLQLVELEPNDFCHAFSSCRRCVSGTILDTRTGEYTLHSYVAQIYSDLWLAVEDLS